MLATELGVGEDVDVVDRDAKDAFLAEAPTGDFGDVFLEHDVLIRVRELFAHFLSYDIFVG